MIRIYPNLNYLLDILLYDPLTGILTWKTRPREHFKTYAVFKSWNARFPCKRAGSLTEYGYILISVDNKGYRAHRLAYYMYYGFIPEGEIDHKDRIKHHNCIKNLREASRQCQMRNKSIAVNNKTGVTGVCLYKLTGMWGAYITVNLKNINLGRFVEFIDAVKARWEAEKKYKFPNCNTTSSAYNYLKYNHKN